MLDFQKKSEIAVSDIHSSIVSVGFLKVKLKVNKNSRELRPGFIAYLFICFIYLLSDGYFVVVVFLNGISSLPMVGVSAIFQKLSKILK